MTKQGWFLIAFLAGVYLASLVISPPARGAEPLRVEAGAGQCQYGQAGKGIWWNDAYPTDIDLRTTCWQLGVSRIEGQWRGLDLGWRAAYVDLGKYQADNQFALRDDEQFIMFDAATCVVATGHHCTGRGVMSGRTRGITLSGLTEKRVGDFTLGLEAGALIYHSRFDVTVTPTSGDGAWSSRMVWGGPGITPLIGATAHYGPLFASVRGYADVKAHEPKCQGCSGITDGLAWQAVVGIQVPLR